MQILILILKPELADANQKNTQTHSLLLELSL